MSLLCLKIYADMLPSIAKSVIAKKLLKIEIPRILQALGGLINAFVACILVSYWVYIGPIYILIYFLYLKNNQRSSILVFN